MGNWMGGLWGNWKDSSVCAIMLLRCMRLPYNHHFLYGGSRNPERDEGMLQMECRNTRKELQIVHIGDIEMMAHLIRLRRERV